MIRPATLIALVSVAGLLTGPAAAGRDTLHEPGEETACNQLCRAWMAMGAHPEPGRDAADIATAPVVAPPPPVAPGHRDVSTGSASSEPTRGKSRQASQAGPVGRPRLARVKIPGPSSPVQAIFRVVPPGETVATEPLAAMPLVRSEGIAPAKASPRPTVAVAPAVVPVENPVAVVSFDRAASTAALAATSSATRQAASLAPGAMVALTIAEDRATRAEVASEGAPRATPLGITASVDMALFAWTWRLFASLRLPRNLSGGGLGAFRAARRRREDWPAYEGAGTAMAPA